MTPNVIGSSGRARDAVIVSSSTNYSSTRTAASNALALIVEPRPVSYPILVRIANLPSLSKQEYAREVFS
jgi:hypothetical protein